MSMFATSHIHVLNIIGPQHFLRLVVHSGIGDAMAPPYKLLTMLTKLLTMFARWHKPAAYFEHQLMGFWSFNADGWDGMESFSGINLHLSVEQKVSAGGHITISLGSPLAIINIRDSIDRQGPRFSIRMDIGIFCSDTVFVQLNQYSQILSRQCRLVTVSPIITITINFLSINLFPS